MNPDHVKDYQDTLSMWNENKKREIISVKEFLAFCNLENAETYFYVVKNITKMENSYRKLPDFKAVLTFDRIVDDYWNSVKGTEDRYRLFPIFVHLFRGKLLPCVKHQIPVNDITGWR